jgi:hypothetical protein
LFSATSGFFITAEAGSLAGTGGMSTSPAPRWPRDDLVLPARVRRLPEPLRVRPLPVPVVPPPVPPEPVPPEPDGAEAEAGAEPAGAAAWAGSGASPQVSQYPPSIVPPQPGLVHFPVAATAAGATGSGASPQVSQYPPSIVPPQPGRMHLMTVLVMAVSPVR